MQCLMSESLFLILRISLLPLTGKAHIRRAIQGHEEALRIYSLCHSLNKLEVLQEILIASHQRSLKKYSENETEEEFTDYTEAPDINRELFFFSFSRDNDTTKNVVMLKSCLTQEAKPEHNFSHCSV